MRGYRTLPDGTVVPTNLMDLTGQRFGSWTVQSYVGKKRWLCACDCGTVKSLLSRNLRSGDTLSCGCLGLRRLNLTGQRFGNWVAQSYDHERQQWRCLCDCGNERYVNTDNLRSGGSQSCGCVYRGGSQKRSAPGTKYGHWTLVRYISDNVWDVQCDCGTKDTKREQVLKLANADSSCGCIVIQKTQERIVALEKALPKPKHSPLLKDLTGQRIGKVIPLEYLGNGKWLCQCECGVTKPLAVGGLRQGKTRSCGCERTAATVARNKAKLSSTAEDLIGKTFGRLQVLAAAQPWHWQCLCSCGTEKVVQHHNLTRGKSRSCGCLLREQNARFRRYESATERQVVTNDRKRQRRNLDPRYAQHVRDVVRLSALRTRSTTVGKAKMATVNAKRRARCLGSFGASEWMLVLEAWGHCCAYCQKPAGRLTQDHVIALSNGGDHEIGNIVPACRRCNSRKSDFELELALARLGCVNFHERRKTANLFLKDVTHA